MMQSAGVDGVLISRAVTLYVEGIYKAYGIGAGPDYKSLLQELATDMMNMYGKIQEVEA
jgi:hypothetical protein